MRGFVSKTFDALGAISDKIQNLGLIFPHDNFGFVGKIMLVHKWFFIILVKYDFYLTNYYIWTK
jgi:hypothetical protein